MACSAPKTSSGCNSWQALPSSRPATSAPPTRRTPRSFRPRPAAISRSWASSWSASRRMVLRRLLAQHLDPDRHLRHRRARAEHPGRLHRPDLDRPRRVLPVRRLHLGLHLQQPADPGVLRDSAGRRRHRAGRADLRHAGGAAEGALSRHRDTGRAIHPARFLLARGLVFRRLGAGQRQAVLDLRLHASAATGNISTWCWPISWSAISSSPI